MKLLPIQTFTLFCLLNTFHFLDRGIIPGSANEFDYFIEKTTHSSKPDAYLGLLQSASMIGLVVGGLCFGHFLDQYDRLQRMRLGCSIWFSAVIFSGISFYSGSYIFLLICRMVTGIGEAALLYTIPPWIQQHADQTKKALWLSMFYAAAPLGLALGFICSSLISKQFGWQFCFLGEALLVSPLVLVLFQIEENQKQGLQPLHSNQVQTSTISLGSLTMKQISSVLQYKSFVCFLFAAAAQSATQMGLNTFGAAFLLGLGYFPDESTASIIFGIVISSAGICGTILGGFLLDQLSLKKLFISPRRKVTTAAAAVADEEQSDVISLLTERNMIPADDIDLLEIITVVSYWSNYLAVILLCSLYFIRDRTCYLFILAIAFFFLFSSSTGISMGCKLSVPPKDRVLALTMSIVVSHIFGDIPSAVISGWVKDSLAPDCIPVYEHVILENGEMDRVFVSVSCQADDDQGLRMTMFFVSVWMFWAVLLFGGAWNYILSDY